MRYQAILFDLDGTLLDTLDDLAESANQALADMGCATHPVDAYRIFVGDGIRTLATRCLPAVRRDDASVDAFVKDMRRIYAARETRKTRPYAGVVELLDELARRGLTLAVLSNKPDEATRSIVSKLLGLERFALVRGERPPAPRKPDPAGARAIAAELKVPAASWLYLGDTGTDMQTARAAGMYAVGALWGFRAEEELRENGAQALAHSPADVLALLG
jgi:phosphoglycolate phosphatase